MGTIKELHFNKKTITSGNVIEQKNKMRKQNILNPFNKERKQPIHKRNQRFNDLNQITIFDILNDLNNDDMN